MSARKSFTPKQRQAVYAKTNGRCAYCGSEITIKQMQVDHIIAVESAQVAKNLNSIENLFPACRPCNYIKSTMSIECFRIYLEGMTNTLSRDSVTYRNALRFGRITELVQPCVFYYEKLGLMVPNSALDAMYYKEAHTKIWADTAPEGAESEGN
jgi:hypothetical protein